MTAAVASFHVLIVEDDPSSSEFVQSALQRAGFESDVAATVSEALLHVEQDWPQAVILDLRLPDADGTVLLRRLKRDRRKTRVAVVTGVADLSSYVDVMHFPPDLLLPKPVNLRKLLKWLDHTRLAYDADESRASGDADADADNDADADRDADRARVAAASAAAAASPADRRERRFAASREVLILPHWEGVDARPEPVRLLDCSAHGLAITRAKPMPVGESFAMFLTPGATSMVLYAVRNCQPLPEGTFKIGAELSGFVGAPEEDPGRLLDTLLRDGPA